MTMPEPYSYLVCYCVHGVAKTFWALDKRHEENVVVLEGYKGQTLELSHATSYVIKEKPRMETPKHVIAHVENVQPSEVRKPA